MLQQMIHYCEIDQINIFPQMTKTLLLEHLVSIRHIIHYEPGINTNKVYRTSIIPVQGFINMIIHW